MRKESSIDGHLRALRGGEGERGSERGDDGGGEGGGGGGEGKEGL